MPCECLGRYASSVLLYLQTVLSGVLVNLIENYKESRRYSEKQDYHGRLDIPDLVSQTRKSKNRLAGSKLEGVETRLA